MILRAQECKERAIAARELARQTKRAATKAALVQTADYWSVLAERLEQREQVLHLSAPAQAHPASMPLVRYLVGVGIALFLGLLAASAQFESRAPDAAAVSTAQTNAALLSKSH
jgi:hypothetical protein